MDSELYENEKLQLRIREFNQTDLQVALLMMSLGLVLINLFR
jgi:hypothetical protein